LYAWLNECKPGGKSWTQARWEKLNEAFGEGWEKECFPYLGTTARPMLAFSGNQPEGRGPVGRDPGGREAVQADPRQVPEGGRRCGRDEAVQLAEAKLRHHLRHTTPTSAPTSSSWPSATAGSPSASPSPSGHGSPAVLLSSISDSRTPRSASPSELTLIHLLTMNIIPAIILGLLAAVQGALYVRCISSHS
jgi:hypothetical protein